jgi:DNA-directed RNA polymerase specialized sigma24 family protein
VASRHAFFALAGAGGGSLGSTVPWSLSAKALEGLLERLGPDRETAGCEYQALWERLVDYFGWKGAREPEVAADETLDRVARRLEQGEAIHRFGAYTFGVARRVLFEKLRLQSREQRASADAALVSAGHAPADEEARTACLMRCLERLPVEERSLIVAYYQGGGRSLTSRKLLAERLGMPYATLKTRAHRLRIRLEACLRSCCEGDSCGP